MTTVTLATGELMPIETGPPGTWRWAREASLISVAYQQAGNYGAALQWRKEFERRVIAYNQIEAGADMEAIISAGSWLDGPAMIVSYLAKTASTIIDAAAKVPQVALDWAGWVPWLIVAGVATIAFGFHKRALRLRL